MQKIYDLIIIGAGPAGLAAAVEAQRGGLKDILVLEKGPSHSQMIRTFYKEGKRLDAAFVGIEALCNGVMCLRDGSRESYLAMMDHVVTQEKIPIECLTEVRYLQATPDKLFEVGTTVGNPYVARTIVIAIGRMNKPTQPEYWKTIPATLKSNKSLLFDINSRELNAQKTLIVGGGDSAGEYAQMLAEKNQVTLSYRKPTFARMNPLNSRMTETLIQTGKIRALMNSNIQTIEDDNNRPRVIFSGTPSTAGSPVTPETFDCVLFALGGMTPIDFLKTANLQMDAKGEPVVATDFESSTAGIYVIGDLLGRGKGGGSIIAGFNSAAAALRSLLLKYFGKELPPEMVDLAHLKF